MPVDIIERTELKNLISPHQDLNFGIYNWHVFKHGYSKELVNTLVHHFNLTKGDWVLDPFCGGGTTLLACKELGINSQGFDILPFSVYLSNVKLENYEAREISESLNLLKISEVITDIEKSLPDIPIVNKAFKPAVVIKLLEIKTKIENIENPKIKAFFNLGFLSIIESVSNTSKTGGFLRIINRQVDPNEIMGIYLSKVESMIKDVVEFNKFNKCKNKISIAKLGDARSLTTKRKYDAVITSPPYPNRHDYTRIYSLEMIFDFVSNNDQLKKIRYETIRSHVEAKKKYEATGYEKPEKLRSLIAQVERNGTNNSQILGMLEGYFEDMYLSLSEISRCLKIGGKAAMVVSNVRFAGINILADEILSDIGSQVGLSPKEIWAMRYRGNSSQQMRDYVRNPSRESIIFWSKYA